MKEIDYNDLDKVCRGCLAKNGEMRPLFGSFLDNMLRAVAEIEVRVNDGLPQLMCVPCVLQVSRAFTFKQVCQRSDQTLRIYLQGLEKSLAEKQSTGNVTDETGTQPVQNINDNHRSALTRETFATNESISSVSSVGETTTSVSHDMQPTEMFAVQYTPDNELDNNNLEKCLMIVSSDLVEHIKLDESDEVDIDNDDMSFQSTNGLLDSSIIASVHSVHTMQQNALSTVDSHDLKNLTTTNPIERNDNDLTTLPLDSDEIPADLLSETYDDYSEHDDHHSTNDEIDNSKEMAESSIFSSDEVAEMKNATEIGCSECNLFFKSSSAYNAHVNCAHNAVTDAEATTTTAAAIIPKSFECPECHKCFAEKKILNRHLKIHNPIKSHACNICDMTFAESSNLTKHMKKHTGELRNVVGKPNLCSACGKGFKWASSLSKHMKHHTGHRILTCSYCPKYYVEARSLNIHLRSHTGEKPFQCHKCNKCFTQMGNLEKHLRVHTGERPFKCGICGRGFSQSGYVAIHLRTHTGERPYKCEVCDKSFAGSNTLAIHKRTHTGEKPYPCTFDNCDKTFARHETAMIHLRTHTGEKPHECNICLKKFISSGHLTGHMRSHNGIKNHECNNCLKRFASSSSLKVHMKIHMDKEMGVPETDLEDTVYECNVCKRNIPLSALKSAEELQAFNHQIIDSVLICSNVTSNALDTSNDKHLIQHSEITQANMLLSNIDDAACIDDGQHIIISLSDMKDELN